MKIQKPNRDEHKRINNVVKKALNVKYDTRSSTSLEDCEEDLINIIKIAIAEGKIENSYKDKYDSLEREAEELRRELKRRKKWWQIWR